MSDAEFAALYNSAVNAGHAAANKVQLKTYEVYSADLDGKRIPGTPTYQMQGLCGFAWVNVKPGTSKFARWLKKVGYGKTDSYAGGVQVWIRDFNQSFELKEAYAQAFAQVLRDAGIRAYAGSRLD